MELLDCPEEILTEIFSNLDQENVHGSLALVCKRFLKLTRSPQLLKCVKFHGKFIFGVSPFLTAKTAKKFQSFLGMLRDNKHIEKLILGNHLDILEILKTVAPHGSLRHIDFSTQMPAPDHPEEWKAVFSQICAKITSVTSIGWRYEENDFDFLAPLANAKYLTRLAITLPSSETFRQMADNYTCLQHVSLYGVDCSENSDVAYFLEKQRQTLTSLAISTPTWNLLPPAISKSQNLKKCFYSYSADLDGLGSLSQLKSLCLDCITNSDLGNSLEAAKFQHLNEIEFKRVILKDIDVRKIAQTYNQQV
jgi:hypothetical protein